MPDAIVHMKYEDYCLLAIPNWSNVYISIFIKFITHLVFRRSRKSTERSNEYRDYTASMNEGNRRKTGRVVPKQGFAMTYI